MKNKKHFGNINQMQQKFIILQKLNQHMHKRDFKVSNDFNNINKKCYIETNPLDGSIT